MRMNVELPGPLAASRRLPCQFMAFDIPLGIRPPHAHATLTPADPLSAVIPGSLGFRSDHIDRIIYNVMVHRARYFYASYRCRAKVNVSPPGCATSRLRPANRMHYFSYRTLTPSVKCHRNSVAWIHPTKIGCHGHVN